MAECPACHASSSHQAKRFDEELRPLQVCLNCGHVQGKPLTAQPADYEPLHGVQGAYWRQPVFYDD